MTRELEPVPVTLLLRSRALTQMYPHFTEYNPERKVLGLRLWPSELRPDSLYQLSWVPAEFILLLLMEGYWVEPGAHWTDYAKLAIASRLRKKKSVIFREHYAQHMSLAFKVQWEGGTYKELRELRDIANGVLQTRTPVPYHNAVARLLLSLADPDEGKRFYHTFHWIRACVATQDTLTLFGQADMQVELLRQKRTLNDVICAGLP